LKLLPTALSGAWLVEPEPLSDERGFFARTFCADEFRRHGLNPAIAQCSISFNRERGTLRGMHYQAAPHEEAKLVRCTQGAIFDAIVDLRPGSATRHRWFGVELTAANRRMLYVPEGFAHGFLTLEPETEVLYQISVAYRPESQRGFHWQDPAVAIAWPQAPRVVSPRDQSLPRLAVP
jgi:dTDP-4-dehydrorhamnose 3,5-epimerase